MLIAFFLFGPGAIATAYYAAITEAERRGTTLLLYWIAFSFFICPFTLGIFYLRGNTTPFPLFFEEVERIVKYGGISIITALALPNLLYVFRRLTEKLQGKSKE